MFSPMRPFRSRRLHSAGDRDQLELLAPAAETAVVGPLSDQERRRLLEIEMGDRRLPSRFWAKVIAERHDELPSACWTWEVAPR